MNKGIYMTPDQCWEHYECMHDYDYQEYCDYFNIDMRLFKDRCYGELAMLDIQSKENSISEKELSEIFDKITHKGCYRLLDKEDKARLEDRDTSQKYLEETGYWEIHHLESVTEEELGIKEANYIDKLLKGGK